MTAFNKHRRLLVEQKLGEREFPEDEVAVPASLTRQLENKEREPGWRQEFGGGDSCLPPEDYSRGTVSNWAAPTCSIPAAGCSTACAIAPTGRFSSKSRRYWSSNAVRSSRASFAFLRVALSVAINIADGVVCGYVVNALPNVAHPVAIEIKSVA